VNLEKTIVRVSLARKQTFKLQLCRTLAKDRKRRFGFGNDLLIFLRLAKRDQVGLIDKLAFDLTAGINRRLQPRTFF